MYSFVVRKYSIVIKKLPYFLPRHIYSPIPSVECRSKRPRSGEDNMQIGMRKDTYGPWIVIVKGLLTQFSVSKFTIFNIS